MKKLNEILAQMEQYLEAHDKVNPSVSAVNVGWHIAHSLIALNGIVLALHQSDPAQYKYQFNLKRVVIMTIGKIPRGRGRAPEIVSPKKTYTHAELALLLDKTRDAIKTLSQLQPNHYFDHPYFNMLNLKPAIKFLAIHSNHHLQIMTDIIKK